MNIFVLHEDPIQAAQMMCDKHIPKMIVESAQMMASALRRHGATDKHMPIAKTTGRPYKGGYHDHPCTVWCGDTQMNFLWLAEHGQELSRQYTARFTDWELLKVAPINQPKVHGCSSAIEHMKKYSFMIPKGALTPFARAFNKKKYPFLYDESIFTAVEAYRAYYSLDKHFAKWEKGTPAPQWWVKIQEENV